jgi:dimeric dUTPase (all-alpha-NTP-PPase superfamily)
MSSGFGIRSQNGRCFAHWKDYKSCISHIQDPYGECKDLLEDYFECLHHVKQSIWMKKVDDKIAERRKEIQYGAPVPSQKHTTHH